ncbi:MAG: ABC transporter permease [Candidatus Nomurabacteria bacterium]|jgi:putative ABC transport system permease protein|nr:ABC transporter permease [Candidatus Nomurabacteria bacterium]
MKIIDVISTANSNLLRNKSRFILTILAVFIGAFTIIMTTGINTGVNGYIDKQMASVGGEGYLEIMPASTMENLGGGGLDIMGDGDVKEYSSEKAATEIEFFTQKDIDKIREIAGVESAKAYQMTSAEYIYSVTGEAKKFEIQIGEMPSDSLNVDMAAGRMVDLNNGKAEIAITDKFIEPLGFKDAENAVNKEVKLAVKNQMTGQTTEVGATISGVMNPNVVGFGRAWINDAAGNELHDIATAGLPDEIKNQSYFAVAQLTDDYLTDEKVTEVKDKLKDMGYSAMTIEDEIGMMKSFFDAVTMVLTIFGGIALIAASIGIVNTLFMAVQERTREIGLMKAMGLGKGKIRLMFSLEAVALGFWGVVLGVVLAFVAKEVANHLAAETFLKALPGFVLVKFDIITLIVICLIVMAIAFLAGTLPARRASKLDPIEALRYE